MAVILVPAARAARRLVDIGELRRVHTFGRLLQQIALALPPVSIILQLAGALKLNSMLVMLVAAVTLFYLGRLVEGYSRPG